MLLLSDTFLGMPVIVHELVDCSLSEEERQPQCVNQRARLWHVRPQPLLGLSTVLKSTPRLFVVASG